MKKMLIGIAVALCLTGCGAPAVYETVTDVYDSGQTAPARSTSVLLPEDAALPVSAVSDGALYICDGYSVTIQTMAGGDLDQTLRAATGFSKEALQPVTQLQGDVTRYDCAWSCAGEGGDLVGRSVVLDDGHYHYVLTVLTEAGRAGQLRQQINDLCASFRAD